jgi:hypothetical protein
VTGRNGLAHAIEKARLRRTTRAGLAHEEPRSKRLCWRKRDHPGGPSIEEPPSHGKHETVVFAYSANASPMRLGREAGEE